MELEEQTEKMIDGALKTLMKYDLKVPKRKRYKNLADKIKIEDAFDKIIEIQQFMLTHRHKYNTDKFEKYSAHVTMLQDLCENTNSLKYYAMLK